jgi:biopolymer transport protein TolR
MAEFSTSQRAYIKRRSKLREMSPEDEAGEINIVPFLDMVMNVLIFVLATITTVFTATIFVPAPQVSNSAASNRNDSEEIVITIKIVREGYIIGAPGGFLQPGCRSVAQASLTIPLRGGNHDTAALTQCMVAIRTHPEWGRQLSTRRNINVAVNGDVPYRVLVNTLDAVRETTPGRSDMFTEPTLGIL